MESHVWQSASSASYQTVRKISKDALERYCSNVAGTLLGGVSMHRNGSSNLKVGIGDITAVQSILPRKENCKDGAKQLFELDQSLRECLFSNIRQQLDDEQEEDARLQKSKKEFPLDTILHHSIELDMEQSRSRLTRKAHALVQDTVQKMFQVVVQTVGSDISLECQGMAREEECTRMYLEDCSMAAIIRHERMVQNENKQRLERIRRMDKHVNELREFEEQAKLEVLRQKQFEFEKQNEKRRQEKQAQRQEMLRIKRQKRIQIDTQIGKDENKRMCLEDGDIAVRNFAFRLSEHIKLISAEATELDLMRVEEERYRMLREEQYERDRLEFLRVEELNRQKTLVEMRREEEQLRMFTEDINRQEEEFVEAFGRWQTQLRGHEQAIQARVRLVERKTESAKNDSKGNKKKRQRSGNAKVYEDAEDNTSKSISVELIRLKGLVPCGCENDGDHCAVEQCSGEFPGSSLNGTSTSWNSLNREEIDSSERCQCYVHVSLGSQTCVSRKVQLETLVNTHNQRTTVLSFPSVDGTFKIEKSHGDREILGKDLLVFRLYHRRRIRASLVDLGKRFSNSIVDLIPDGPDHILELTGQAHIPVRKLKQGVLRLNQGVHWIKLHPISEKGAKEVAMLREGSPVAVARWRSKLENIKNVMMHSRQRLYLNWIVDQYEKKQHEAKSLLPKYRIFEIDPIKESLLRKFQLRVGYPRRVIMLLSNYFALKQESMVKKISKKLGVAYTHARRKLLLSLRSNKTSDLTNNKVSIATTACAVDLKMYVNDRYVASDCLRMGNDLRDVCCSFELDLPLPGGCSGIEDVCVELLVDHKQVGYVRLLGDEIPRLAYPHGDCDTSNESALPSDAVVDDDEQQNIIALDSLECMTSDSGTAFEVVPEDCGTSSEVDKETSILEETKLHHLLFDPPLAPKRNRKVELGELPLPKNCLLYFEALDLVQQKREMVASELGRKLMLSAALGNVKQEAKWIICQDDAGNQYWYNNWECRSTWDRPGSFVEIEGEEGKRSPVVEAALLIQRCFRKRQHNRKIVLQLCERFVASFSINLEALEKEWVHVEELYLGDNGNMECWFNPSTNQVFHRKPKVADTTIWEFEQQRGSQWIHVWSPEQEQYYYYCEFNGQWTWDMPRGAEPAPSEPPCSDISPEDYPKVVQCAIVIQRRYRAHSQRDAKRVLFAIRCHKENEKKLKRSLQWSQLYDSWYQAEFFWDNKHRLLYWTFPDTLHYDGPPLKSLAQLAKWRYKLDLQDEALEIETTIGDQLEHLRISVGSSPPPGTTRTLAKHFARLGEIYHALQDHVAATRYWVVARELWNLVPEARIRMRILEKLKRDKMEDWEKAKLAESIEESVVSTSRGPPPPNGLVSFGPPPFGPPPFGPPPSGLVPFGPPPIGPPLGPPPIGPTPSGPPPIEPLPSGPPPIGPPPIGPPPRATSGHPPSGSLSNSSNSVPIELSRRGHPQRMQQTNLHKISLRSATAAPLPPPPDPPELQRQEAENQEDYGAVEGLPSSTDLSPRNLAKLAQSAFRAWQTHLNDPYSYQRVNFLTDIQLSNRKPYSSGIPTSEDGEIESRLLRNNILNVLFPEQCMRLDIALDAIQTSMKSFFMSIKSENQVLLGRIHAALGQYANGESVLKKRELHLEESLGTCIQQQGQTLHIEHRLLSLSVTRFEMAWLALYQGRYSHAITLLYKSMEIPPPKLHPYQLLMALAHLYECQVNHEFVRHGGKGARRDERVESELRRTVQLAKDARTSAFQCIVRDPSMVDDPLCALAQRHLGLSQSVNSWWNDPLVWYYASMALMMGPTSDVFNPMHLRELFQRFLLLAEQKPDAVQHLDPFYLLWTEATVLRISGESNQAQDMAHHCFLFALSRDPASVPSDCLGFRLVTQTASVVDQAERTFHNLTYIARFSLAKKRFRWWSPWMTAVENGIRATVGCAKIRQEKCTRLLRAILHGLKWYQMYCVRKRETRKRWGMKHWIDFVTSRIAEKHHSATLLQRSIRGKMTRKKFAEAKSNKEFKNSLARKGVEKLNRKLRMKAFHAWADRTKLLGRVKRMTQQCVTNGIRRRFVAWQQLVMLSHREREKRILAEQILVEKRKHGAQMIQKNYRYYLKREERRRVNERKEAQQQVQRIVDHNLNAIRLQRFYKRCIHQRSERLRRAQLLATLDKTVRKPMTEEEILNLEQKYKRTRNVLYSAAITIQGLFRGKLVRLRQQKQRELGASILIQAVVRGRLGRIRARPLIQEALTQASVAWAAGIEVEQRGKGKVSSQSSSAISNVAPKVAKMMKQIHKLDSALGESTEADETASHGGTDSLIPSSTTVQHTSPSGAHQESVLVTRIQQAQLLDAQLKRERETRANRQLWDEFNSAVARTTRQGTLADSRRRSVPPTQRRTGRGRRNRVGKSKKSDDVVLPPLADFYGGVQ